MRQWRILAAIGLMLGATACGPAVMAPIGSYAGVDAFGSSKLPTPSKYGAYGAIIEPGTPAVIYDNDGGIIRPPMTEDDNGFRTQALPDRADLRSACPPVRNQGYVGACTGFAAAGFRETLAQTQGGASTPLSPRFIYYAERQMMDGMKKYPYKCRETDSGAPTILAMEVLSKVGAATEQASPFIAISEMAGWSKLTQESRALAIKNFVSAAPDGGAFSEAKRFRLPNGYRDLPTLSNIKHALKSGLPVLMAMKVYSSFETEIVAKTGRMPVPNLKKEKLEGGHAICVVGYDNREGHLIVRNSWGANWGDKGYFYMPYEFVKMGLTHSALTQK